MHVLSQLDPEGCLQRRCKKLRRRKYSIKVNLNPLLYISLFPSKGPNYLWHTDGYDKLKPYGFCIHGGYAN